MSSSELVRLRVIIRGRVQGVGFRRFVFKQSQKYQLGGWVRNNPDGTVEVEALGDSQTIASFCRDLGNGSFFARVDEVEEVSREICKDTPTEKFIIKN